MDELEKKTVLFASRHYLTEPLPENYDEMDDFELAEFVEDHAWEPFEYYSANQILEFIYGLSGDLKSTLNRGFFDE